MKSTTPSEENYIECLYRCSLQGPVRPSVLAEKLGVKRPSVTRAMAGLAKKGLVEHERYGAIELTEAGHAVGREIVRRDDCLTALLVDVLGMSQEHADPEVHRLEHLLSGDLLVRLEALVEAAQSSKAFLTKLRALIQEAEKNGATEGAFDPGAALVHAGSPREKTEGGTLT
jgi:DtxR family Mn-dependent transcriptional regulator